MIFLVLTLRLEYHYVNSVLYSEHIHSTYSAEFRFGSFMMIFDPQALAWYRLYQKWKEFALLLILIICWFSYSSFTPAPTNACHQASRKIEILQGGFLLLSQTIILQKCLSSHLLFYCLPFSSLFLFTT